MKNPLPPYAKRSKTSKDAAESMRIVAPTLRSQVLAFIKMHGDYGCTSTDVCQGVGIDINNASARLSELQMTGEIKDNGKTRINPFSGRLKAVYVATGDVAKPLPKRSASERAKLQLLIELRDEIATMHENNHSWLDIRNVIAMFDNKIKEMSHE